MTTLCEVPDTVEMTRDFFKSLLRRHPGAKQYGFSRKHTADIADYRRKFAGEWSMPAGQYGLPVVWNAEKTYVAK